MEVMKSMTESLVFQKYENKKSNSEEPGYEITFIILIKHSVKVLNIEETNRT